MKDFSFVDEKIRAVVVLLNRHGFKTFESCQGGEGHCFKYPTVRFEGSEFDLIKAHNICEVNNLNVMEGKRVYRKTPLYNDEGVSIGEAWETPFNELIFIESERTGSIYLKHNL